MSSTSESSESSRTLPRAELNPLLNPVLASHMGRWAEVYFTSPPEKREEAVLELLRELEAEDPGNASVTPLPDRETRNEIKHVSSTEGNGRLGATAIVRCQRCGHENPTSHQFCGMCGSSLQSVGGQEFRADSPYEQHHGEMENHQGHAPFPPAQQELPESNGNESRQPGDRFRSDPYDLSMLQGLRQREIDDYEYEEEPSHSYRYYIGAVLAVLLLLLGYMAWRSGQLSQGSHQASAPPPAAPTENVRAAQPSSPQPSASAPQPTTSAPAASATAPSTPPKVQQPTASSSNSNAEAAKLQPPDNATRPAKSVGQNSAPVAAATNPAPTEPQFSSTSGADDLAMAQHFLNGTNGQARDPAQAAKYLWRAMGKHNGPATLQLADLYLKGEGVPKNCDQARILLDSAAIRGMKGAGERLRNLQAFGCQ